MNTRPISTSTASVSGKRMMMVLAAEKPGIAPTTRPSRIAGMITHQKVSAWANSEKKSSASISEHRLDQPLEGPRGEARLEGDDEQDVAAESKGCGETEDEPGAAAIVQGQHGGGQEDKGGEREP